MDREILFHRIFPAIVGDPISNINFGEMEMNNYKKLICTSGTMRARFKRQCFVEKQSVLWRILLIKKQIPSATLSLNSKMFKILKREPA